MSWAGLAISAPPRATLSGGSFQASVDVPSSGSSFQHSGRLSAGPTSVNYSVSGRHCTGHLQLSGRSEHNSVTLLQAGLPGQARLSAKLQTHGKAPSAPPQDRRASSPHPGACSPLSEPKDILTLKALVLGGACIPFLGLQRCVPSTVLEPRCPQGRASAEGSVGGSFLASSSSRRPQPILGSWPPLSDLCLCVRASSLLLSDPRHWPRALPTSTRLRLDLIRSAGPPFPDKAPFHWY